MRYKFMIASAIVASVLSGCGQPAPDLDETNGGNNTSTVTGNEDTVSIDDNSYGNETNTDINSENLTGNNSSGDNFRSIYFGFGDYSISSDMEPYMNKNKSVAMGASSQIKVEGNCDEFGTDEYNYALGVKRASAVKNALIAQGVPESRLKMVSFGESTPVCREATDSCYERNRRVDLRLAR